ncbi:hypothetical protein D1007_53419 [Hordeum vulgare]|nr:hypothetical protein D1007_53419 [Hordeum vulgare]
MQGPLPPPPLREHIIREAVTRRLTEEWALGDLAFARRLSEGFGPDPFFAPDLLMPPPHAPMPMPMPMHPLPHAPFEGFGAWQWQGPGPRRHAGFGGRTPFPREEKRKASPPRPDPKRKVKLPETEPSGTPEALSPKVAMMKRKADANAATTVPKKVQKLAEDWSCSLCQVIAPSEAGLNEHLGGRKHKAKLAQCGVSEVIKDDKNCLQTTIGNENSTDPCDAPKKICMLVDGATCEAGLNEDLGGRKLKAELALCGASKAIKDDKNSLHTTTGNKNSTDPCDAPKKIFLEVDGEMHEVVRKNNYLWCDRCRVRGDSNVIMAGHLRGKKHSKLNMVWTSIKAVRTNTNTKEGLPSCGSQVNTNGSTEIPGVIEGNINMTTEVDESSPVENPVQKEIHLQSKKHSKSNNVWTSIKALRTNTDTKKGLPSCGSQLNTNGPVENPVQKEIHLWNKKHSKSNNVWTSIKAVRTNTDTKKGLPSCGSQLSTNGPVENPVQKEIHLRNKKHSKLNNVWTSIKAVRTSTDTKEGLPSCGSQLNTNVSSEIPAVIEGNINMTTEVDESGPVENPVQIEIHPWSKTHSKLNKVWTSIKAVKTNTNTKEGFPSCGSQVTPCLKELIMFKAQQGAKSDPSSAPEETSYANDSSQKRKPCQMTSKVQPPAKKRKYKPRKTVSSDDHRLKEQSADSRLQEAGEVSRGKAKAPVEIQVQTNRKEITRMATIKAVRTNTDTKEGFPSSCGSQVNTNGSTEISAVIEGDINMTTLVDESGPVENPVWKEITRMAAIKAVRKNTDTKEGLPSCGSQVNTNDSTEIPAVIEGNINMTTGVDESGPVENPIQKEITRMATIWAMFSS